MNTTTTRHPSLFIAVIDNLTVIDIPEQASCTLFGLSHQSPAPSTFRPRPYVSLLYLPIAFLHGQFSLPIA